jgi:hypothetical protein
MQGDEAGGPIIFHTTYEARPEDERAHRLPLK